MKMIKQMIVTLAAAALLFSQVGTVFANDMINVYVKGKLQVFEQSAIIKDGVTLVPMRGIFEALGATVKWDGSQQIIDAKKNGKIIRLKIGWKGAWIGETKAALDVAPQIINGSTMVPLRFIGEALGEKVEWDKSTRSVLILTDKSQLPKADSGVYKGYASIIRDVIKSNTLTGLKMPETTYKILGSNGDGFFAANRNKFSLYDKAKKVSTADISKNPAQYSSTIVEVNRIRIFEARELNIDKGKIITMAYGESESGGLFFQIFYAGSKKLAKEDVIEMVGIPAGKSQISVINRLGAKYDAPVTVFVAGNIFSALEEYQLQAERGKGQTIQFDEEAQNRLDKDKTKSYVGEMGLIAATEDGKLSSAAYSGNITVVKLLLEAGAIPSDFALSTAKDKPEILALLKSAQ